MDNEQGNQHRLTTADVGRICDAPAFVDHYRLALSQMGLWNSEEILVNQFFEPHHRMLDLGCGTGRVGFGLWDRGFRNIQAVDISVEMIAVASEHAMATGRGVEFVVGDATDLSYPDDSFDGIIFGFGGLMQIPGRSRRQEALREIKRILRPQGTFIFTSHDREMEEYRGFWREQEDRPTAHGLEFGDIYEEGPHGLVFVHVPDCREVEEDLDATGWSGVQSWLRSEISEEDEIVEELSDPCRFWIARKC